MDAASTRLARCAVTASANDRRQTSTRRNSIARARDDERRWRADARDQQGDPNCPHSYVTNDTTVPLKLGGWLSNQRNAKKGQGSWKISDEQIRRLEELGV
jgi:hypothetical protein